MTHMLQGSSGQSPQPNDDPPYERHTPSKGSPQKKARGPSKRPHARRAAELLAAQLMAESIALPDNDAPVKSEDCGNGQQAESSLIPTPQEDWQARR